MTEPTQSGPYAGQPAPPPQPTAPAPGWPAPPPQQGGPYPYATTPPAGYGRPPAPPGDPAAASDRVSGALLVLGALLAVGASFATLDESVQYVDEAQEEPVYRTVAKAWSYTSGGTGEEMESVTQFSGVPLLLGALMAIAAAVLLLTGRSRRLALAPAFGVASAVLLLGTTLSVLTEAVNDTQWDEDGRTTTFGAGFYLLTVAGLLALGATVTTVLATRRPAGAFPGPAQAAFQTPQPPQTPQPWQAAQPPQPWQAALGVPATQPYPPGRPPAPHQPPPPAAD
ncbi:hypothetical protein ACFU53_47580 [Streptomyces sp. NPDC057474]|uniref:hypothetical protein n=1 Tax=Streptomyces sp. NPDC057474 TaxID=3346144 RepID=UPI00367F011E